MSKRYNYVVNVFNYSQKANQLLISTRSFIEPEIGFINGSADHNQVTPGGILMNQKSHIINPVKSLTSSNKQL